MARSGLPAYETGSDKSSTMCRTSSRLMNMSTAAKHQVALACSWSNSPWSCSGLQVTSVQRQEWLHCPNIDCP